MDTRVFPERGESALDQRAYRRCLSQFGTGVTVITADDGEQRTGVTANSFSSLSLDPPLVTWAIKRDSRSREVFMRAGHFAVNILADDQIDVSRTFATSNSDKFANTRWAVGEGGAPLIDNVSATLECDVENIMEGGDHVLVVGRVKRFCVFDKPPLLFVQGRYGVAVDHPELKPMPGGRVSNLVSADTSLMVLLLYAYQAMSHKFDDRRKQVGMSLSQSRVLAVLRQNPEGLMMGPLAALTYLGVRDAEDAIADLSERGYVRTDGQKLFLTDRGLERREAILRHLRDFDVEQMSSFSAAEVATARRVLTHLIRANSEGVQHAAH